MIKPFIWHLAVECSEQSQLSANLLVDPFLVNIGVTGNHVSGVKRVVTTVLSPLLCTSKTKVLVQAKATGHVLPQFTCSSLEASGSECIVKHITWWRHQMENISALLALCAVNSPVPGEFPSQRPVTRNFNVFFDLLLNKRLSKQSRRRWFETSSRSLWCPCNGD